MQSGGINREEFMDSVLTKLKKLILQHPGKKLTLTWRVKRDNRSSE